MNNETINIIWSSADREVAIKMVFMYTHNSKLRNWWKTVRLIVWGPSAKLLAEDPELQLHIESMIEAGVLVCACKKCADESGVAESLSQMGIDVKYMGEPLTEILKNGEKVLTF